MSNYLSVQTNGRVMELVLDRAQKLNAIDETMLEALKKQVIRFTTDPELRVFLLRANGRAFSAGGDMESALFPELSHESPAAFRSGMRAGKASLGELADMIAATEKPTVVAHQGMCLGGALELSLAFDFRLASTAATYALPETRFGVVPSAGGVSRLTHLVGTAWARWLLVAGMTLTAERAATIGLVHEVYAPDELETAAQNLAGSLEKMPPEAAAAANAAIDLVQELGSASARQLERLAASSLVFGAEYRDEIARVMAQLKR